MVDGDLADKHALTHGPIGGPPIRPHDLLLHLPPMLRGVPDRGGGDPRQGGRETSEDGGGGVVACHLQLTPRYRVLKKHGVTVLQRGRRVLRRRVAPAPFEHEGGGGLHE
eukprot:CAMPEP_0169454560 /NCGR_PEP_ID=MMETSP1042-20121227/15343_1 /TAXON_ID=464988 /ORGANISM="Hemiselmis andersenii, Strain CCMP1180" /LENGTH=109 /DNA_ID=CAMNT_0009566641 /DNA_START=158 /DNA_END=487 /DNA_ORIENTATION=-